MALQSASFFLGLSIFTLVGFILRALSRNSHDGESSIPGLKLKTQAAVVVLTVALWLFLIFLK